MELLIILLLILLNGLFSLSEIALVSARRARLEGEAKRGSASAKAALEMAEHPNRLLSTVQIGITLVGILTGIYSGEKITDNFEAWLMQFEVIRPYAHPVALTLVLVVITYFSLVLGELVPKRIGLTHPERFAKLMARPMYILGIITAPFVWLLGKTSDLILKVLNIKQSDNGVTEEEIKAMVQEGTNTGAVQEIEQNIVERVFHLGDRKVGQLMTPRHSMVFLSVQCTAAQVREVLNTEMHSMYPVYENDKDHIIGAVSLKDLFATIDKPDFTLHNIVKPARFFTESMTVYKALENFKETKYRYGIIADEFGIVQGVITINDILEALVGDVSEFYDDEYKIEEKADGTWMVDGHYPMHDFLIYFEKEELLEEAPFNTLSGLILDQLGKVPKEGDTLAWKNFDMEIVDMDRIKIDKVLVKIAK